MPKTHPPFVPETDRLETPRLLLRIDTEESYRTRFETSSDEALMGWYGITDPAALELEKLKVAGGMTTYRTALLYFHLVLKETGKVVGSFAYHNWHPQHRRSEIGYAMKADAYKNKGYMKEALPQMIAYGFGPMDLNRMEAFISPDNMASQKVVARAGFRREGHLHQHFSNNGMIDDSIVYALLREEYVAGSSINRAV